MADAPSSRHDRPSPGGGWLGALGRAAAAAGVAVGEATSRDGVLTVELRPAGAPPLRVDVLPRAAGERYFAATPRHGLRHHGTARPSPAAAAAISAFARALAAVEARLPAAFGLGPGAADGAGIVTVERAGSGAGALFSELLVRVTARCNQACPFCSAPPPHPDADPVALRRRLDEELPRHPRPAVTLTGGEPTLWTPLPDLAAELAARPGVELVKVQTNAVTFASRAALAPYRPGPRLTFFVSFHGATAARYDAATGTRGQLDRAVLGVRNLLDAGHPVTLNVVATRENADHLDAWVDGVAARFGGAPALRVHFSAMTCPEHRPGAPDCLVPYRVLAPRLAAAVARARAAGLACDPLLASSHAALPPCLLPPGERVRGTRGGDAVVPLHAAAATTAEDAVRGWVKAPACADCREAALCLGLPRAYAARFGTGELAPLA